MSLLGPKNIEKYREHYRSLLYNFILGDMKNVFV